MPLLLKKVVDLHAHAETALLFEPGQKPVFTFWNDNLQAALSNWVCPTAEYRECCEAAELIAL